MKTKKDKPNEISRCAMCGCMTKTIGGNCGKCKAKKSRTVEDISAKPAEQKPISLSLSAERETLGKEKGTHEPMAYPCECKRCHLLGLICPNVNSEPAPALRPSVDGLSPPYGAATEEFEKWWAIRWTTKTTQPLLEASFKEIAKDAWYAAHSHVQREVEAAKEKALKVLVECRKCGERVEFEIPDRRMSEQQAVEKAKKPVFGNCKCGAGYPICGECFSAYPEQQAVEKAMGMRPEIIDFAQAMEAKMKANDVKKGNSWKTMKIGLLTSMLRDELEEWNDSNYMRPEEVVDAANFAMMIWSNSRYPTRPNVKSGEPKVKK